MAPECAETSPYRNNGPPEHSPAQSAIRATGAPQHGDGLRPSRSVQPDYPERRLVRPAVGEVSTSIWLADRAGDLLVGRVGTRPRLRSRSGEGLPDSRRTRARSGRSAPHGAARAPPVSSRHAPDQGIRSYLQRIRTLAGLIQRRDTSLSRSWRAAEHLGRPRQQGGRQLHLGAPVPVAQAWAPDRYLAATKGHGPDVASLAERGALGSWRHSPSPRRSTSRASSVMARVTVAGSETASSSRATTPSGLASSGVVPRRAAWRVGLGVLLHDGRHFGWCLQAGTGPIHKFASIHTLSGTTAGNGSQAGSSERPSLDRLAGRRVDSLQVIAYGAGPA